VRTQHTASSFQTNSAPRESGTTGPAMNWPNYSNRPLGADATRRRGVLGREKSSSRTRLPILGIYHNNRLEEFAQLHRADVRCEDGIHYLDINDEGSKQVKNEQSKRRVPIHRAVQHMGFLQYVEQIAPNPGDPIFPQLVPGGSDRKLGHHFTKWWTNYRKAIITPA
jgi:hypothetical protein